MQINSNEAIGLCKLWRAYILGSTHPSPTTKEVVDFVLSDIITSLEKNQVSKSMTDGSGFTMTWEEANGTT